MSVLVPSTPRASGWSAAVCVSQYDVTDYLQVPKLVGSGFTVFIAPCSATLGAARSDACSA